MFYYQSDDTRYIPRAILVDLEPRVWKIHGERLFCSLVWAQRERERERTINMLISGDAQVLNGIQTGPYKNIYNPENFYVGKNGMGAANNWGDGYQSGEAVCEDIMEMIDREADGSDSLEV